MRKAKISMTIADDLAKEIDLYFRKIVARAREAGKPTPKLSNVYEEIIRKGWGTMKRRRK